MDESSVTFQLSVSGPGEFGLSGLVAQVHVKEQVVMGILWFQPSFFPFIQILQMKRTRPAHKEEEAIWMNLKLTCPLANSIDSQEKTAINSWFI